MPSMESRRKSPVAPGYSQMHWMRLCNKPGAAGALTGLGPSHRPGARRVTMEEVRAHKAEGWTVLRGKVYCIAQYVPFHPGGARTLLSGAGRDMTKDFDKVHRWVNAEFMMEKCLVGMLNDGQQETISEEEEHDSDHLA
uniref:Cytochrome b5 heme-binding domain-containing protein n=1 Tax=Prasinoderma singulare TaxID=676789 RepID=A0A7S3BG49_9VIRI|mmetsp:Transcript_16870/g.52372  ORF Transcript_16870/g.52372 Transcript_16870/m.52372 type:complete len:139 (+) Transcript_16870:226-642(+)